MKISDFDYNLPDEKIAKFPPKKRGTTNLLVLNKTTKKIIHDKYFNLPKYLNEGDLVILNNTKVIKARLYGQKETGGKVELLLLEKHNDKISTSKIMYKGKLKPNDKVKVLTKENQPTKYEVTIKSVLEGGIALVESKTNLYKITEEVGEVPIPPYLHRNTTKEDETRYQTLFAKEKGSVAAPTASLNFTDEIQNKLKEKQVDIEYITLHVGLGTFMPVREDEVEKHKMHKEYYEISKNVAEKIIKTKQKGHKVVAVGTTVTRALEHASEKILNAKNTKNEICDEADIFIYPGYKFKIVDALLTNFHAPRSTVLLLASAFAGIQNLKHAYTEALNRDYKFLSYGDSMLVL